RVVHRRALHPLEAGHLLARAGLGPGGAFDAAAYGATVAVHDGLPVLAQHVVAQVVPGVVRVRCGRHVQQFNPPLYPTRKVAIRARAGSRRTRRRR
ncbi:hypothetical protein HMPREF0298_0048, partial [Corynebacterium lipophiloflavum DSM 44291]